MADTEGLELLRRAAEAKLDTQVMFSRRFQYYYDGQSDIVALLGTEDRQTFMKFLDESHSNWTELVVNAVAERLSVIGFRFADTAASDLAWLLWQASCMDADGELVQTDALVTGKGVVLVQPDDDTDNPTGIDITAESPFECTVLYRPGDRRERIAGYKRFAGDPQEWPWPAWMGEPVEGTTEVLITPEFITTWTSGSSEPYVADNPTGLVGMVEIIPQPRTLGPPRSELAPAIPIQDRIHTTLFNRMVAVDYGANRQVTATGVRIPRQVATVTADDGSTEEVVTYVAPYNVGANRLLVSENPDARFGVIPESSLAGYLAAVEQDVTHMAAITQTPPHYLLGKIVNVSADAITAAEAGLVSKVSRRAQHIGEGWEEVIRTAFRILGNPAASDVTAETIWRDFQTRSEAQRVDALVKMRTLGVPVEALWARWGATPAEIEEWRKMRAAEESGPQLAPSPVPTTASGRSKAPGPTLPVRE
jgi:hypothetical protein